MVALPWTGLGVVAFVLNTTRGLPQIASSNDMEIALLFEFSIAFALLVALVAAFEVGFRTGRRVAVSSDVPGGAQIGAVQGAILGLLGLLLGFSFSGASARYLERQELIIRDAGAISIAWQRADFIDEPYRGELRRGLARAVDLRLAVATASPDELQTILSDLDDANHEMWRAVQGGVAAKPSMMIAVLAPVTEVIDMKERRIGATTKHLPELVMGILVTCSLIALGVIGFGCGLSRHRLLPMTLSLSVLVGGSLWAIVDLDHPRDGLIRLDDSPLKRAIPRPITTAALEIQRSLETCTSCSRSVAVRAPLREQSTEVRAIHGAVAVQVAKGGAGARWRWPPVSEHDAKVAAVHRAVAVEVGYRSQEHGQVLRAGDVVHVGCDAGVAASCGQGGEPLVGDGTVNAFDERGQCHGSCKVRSESKVSKWNA